MFSSEIAIFVFAEKYGDICPMQARKIIEMRFEKVVSTLLRMVLTNHLCSFGVYEVRLIDITMNTNLKTVYILLFCLTQ
jgi:hypothetical protein